MSSKTCGCEHDFTLVLTGVGDLTDAVQDKLFSAGCDDATIALRSGRLYMTFSREAATLKDAILAAIRGVRSAEIGADVLRVDYCNLVTQSDVARKIGRSRQLVHQYVTGARGPGDFPPQACEIVSDVGLWYWCEVAYWLCENGMIRSEVLRDAEEVDIINNVLEMERMKRTHREVTEEVLRSVT